MNSPTTEQGSAARWLLLLFVRFYQIFFSPFLGGACKFYPSCSRYAQEAIEVHGARRGAWLAMKRLGRCRPFTKGGFDPVPDVPEKKDVVAELAGAQRDRRRGASAAKAAARIGEAYIVAEATTHKANPYAWVDYGDADWLRTMGKERAQ
jgi:putative membrane protein insertion efficiency factor